MKTTITAFRADLGGVGGHLRPSLHVCQAVSDYVSNDLQSLLIGADVSFTGDDIIIGGEDAVICPLSPNTRLSP